MTKKLFKERKTEKENRTHTHKIYQLNGIHSPSIQRPDVLFQNAPPGPPISENRSSQIKAKDISIL